MEERQDVECGSWSDQGPRDNNEDQLAFDADRGILVIADGMGGHPCGDLASAEAVKSVMSLLQDSPRPHDALEMACTEAHDHVAGHGDNRGTTLTMAVITENTLHIGHVGDTRVFVDGEQITVDQGKGQILHQFIGGRDAPLLQLHQVSIKPGSHILLTTDGVHDHLDIPTLFSDIVALCGNRLEEIARVLSQTAVQLGSDDNCTALVARVGRS